MIEPISGVALGSAAHATGVSQAEPAAQRADALADRFQRLMLDTPPEQTAQAPQARAASAWSEVFRAHESMLRNVETGVVRFAADAPHLNPGELAARYMDLSMQAQRAQIQFSAATSLAQAGRSGLQTLMKNQ